MLSTIASFGLNTALCYLVGSTFSIISDDGRLTYQVNILVGHYVTSLCSFSPTVHPETWPNSLSQITWEIYETD